MDCSQKYDSFALNDTENLATVLKDAMKLVAHAHVSRLAVYFALYYTNLSKERK